MSPYIAWMDVFKDPKADVQVYLVGAVGMPPEDVLLSMFDELEVQ